MLRQHLEQSQAFADRCGGELAGADTCGLPGVRLHDLRHFNASALLASGTDLRTVSGRLGHADASTTLNIYSHFVRQADEKAAGNIGAVLDC